MRPAYLLYGVLFLLIFALLSTPNFKVKMFGIPIDIWNPFSFLGSLMIYGPINVSNLVLILGFLIILWGIVARDNRYNAPQVAA